MPKKTKGESILKYTQLLLEANRFKHEKIRSGFNF